MSTNTTLVVRAEAYYRPRPARPGRPADDWSHIPVAERIFHWYRAWLGRTVPVPTVTVSGLVYARINHNRWLGDCHCGNAQLISPSDQRMACPECGYDWVTVVWPTTVDAIEADMLTRPLVRDRNWWNPDDPNNPDRPIPEAARRGE
ncbi:hypothetical protein GCM10010387_22310 [Streptomyces inusitatus]|uniref:Uncharacterized protein n=1 Tax=Streptomyces inusitatus TaxID=68221 RepID=A0A918UR80_9ACTN|nr:hypothetical protein [Streptomyces inusitatus]GGZ28399.1 hypothetical protein GCM10010387_22310 [Streptomyces inusitatus]